MKTTTVAILLAAMLTLSGCVGSVNYIPDAARTGSTDGVSIKHPVEMEKAGDQYVVTGVGILDVGTWGVESVKGGGIWPVPVEQVGSKPLVGYAIATDLNWWGDYLIQLIMVGRLENMTDSKIIYLDRDGGKIHDLTGKEFDYDPKKFDDDPAYAHQVFQHGMTLREGQKFWQMYCKKRGVSPDKMSFREIKVGSPEWTAFKAELAARLGHNYKMPNGEIREGYLSLEDFRKQDASVNTATSGQRFAKDMNFNFGAPDFGIASSILNGLIDANSDQIQGFYARATCLREDLKPNFRLMQEMYKQLLVQRDFIIRDLQERLQRAKSRLEKLAKFQQSKAELEEILKIIEEIDGFQQAQGAPRR